MVEGRDSAPIRKSSVPCDTVHVDHLGPFAKSMKGNSYVLMVVDAFTKFTVARATRTLRSTEAVEKLQEIFGEYGYPRRLISDRGLAFTSKTFAEFLARRGVKHVLNAIATPRANGQVERQNRTLVEALGASTECESRWDEKVSDVVWGMNRCVNASTGFSPAQLMFSHQSGVNADLSGGMQEKEMAEKGESLVDIQAAVSDRRAKASENLTKASAAMKARYDKRRKVATSYKVGDLVLWRNAPTCSGDSGVNRKLLSKYGGPYRVARVLGNDRYRIASVKGLRGYKSFEATVAADALRRYHSSGTGLEGDAEESDDGAAVDRQDLIDLLEG